MDGHQLGFKDSRVLFSTTCYIHLNQNRSYTSQVFFLKDAATCAQHDPGSDILQNDLYRFPEVEDPFAGISL